MECEHYHMQKQQKKAGQSNEQPKSGKRKVPSWKDRAKVFAYLKQKPPK